MKRSINAAIALSLALTPLNSLPISAEDEPIQVLEEPSDLPQEEEQEGEREEEEIIEPEQETVETVEPASATEEKQDEEAEENPVAPASVESSLTYTYNTSNMTATVTGADKSETSIEIPETVTDEAGNTYKVTSIAAWAFSNYNNLTSVTMPDSIISIGDGAFCWCQSLETIQLSSNLKSINSDLFSGCKSLTDITIPDSVTSIGSSAFEWCASLTSIAIPNSVTSIGSSAFEECTSLPSITIPNSVTSIGSSAFFWCSSLTSITIPESVTSISNHAFACCNDLTSITIPDSVTSIGSSAFSGCSSLTSITIPNSVTSIGSSAFYNCYNLTSITIPDSVTSIGSSAFYKCTSLTSITIPDSVTSIGSSAFEECTSLTSITIPDSVTSIGDKAFYECTSLTSITIRDSVTSIGDYAFYECTSLTSITTLGSVTSIGYKAFYNCYNLTSITIPDSVTSIGDYAFAWCSYLASITISDSVTSIGDYAFYGCWHVKNIYYSSSLTTIPTSGVLFTPETEKLPDSLESGTAYASKKLLLPIHNNTYELNFEYVPASIIGWTPLEELPESLQSYIESKGVTYINNAEIILDKDSYVQGDNSITIQSWPLASIELNGETLDDPVWIDGTATISNLKAGENTITTTNKYGDTSTVIFMVAPTAVKSVSLNKTSLSLVEKETEQLTASVMPSNALNMDVTWSTSDKNVAMVDSNGLVTAVNPGEAEITVTTEDGGYTASCKVVVTPILVQSISLSKSELSLMKGTSEQLSASVSPEDAYDKTINWTSSNPDIVQVDASGNITAVEEGQATVTAASKDGGASDTCVVTVTEIIPTSVELDSHEVTLTVEDTSALHAVVLPDNAKNKNVTWTSSDSNIVSVDSNGNIKAVGVGTATITATTEKEGLSDSCTVKVNPILVSKIELDTNTLTLNKGDSETLAATVSPNNATNKTIVWTSSNEKVATVENGVVKTIGAGTAIITAASQDGNAKAECTVNVEDIPVESLVLNKKSLYVETDSSVKLTATITPDNATNKEVVWTSSDPDNVEVDQTGLVTMKGHGNAVITASSKENPNIKAECQIIEFVPVTGVALGQTELTLTAQGNTVQLEASILPANATVQDKKWTSSNEEIAKVDNQGNVTPLKAGTTDITVTVSNGYTDTCKVTVLPISVSSVSLDKTSLNLKTGEQDTLTASITPANADNKTVSWTSSNEKVATVKDGTVTAVGPGSAEITVATMDGGYTASCTVTVTQPVTSVSLDKSELSIVRGQTASLSASVSPSNASNKSVSWDSSDSDVVEVDKDGNITAKKVGTAEITVITEDGGYTASCKVTVLPIAVTSISLDKTSLILKTGEQDTLTASISPANADNKAVSWKSSDSKVATVKDGTVVAVGPGSAEITVETEDGKFTASCAVTVTQPVTSVSLDKSELSIINGQSASLTASVSPSNASNKSVSWDSSDSSVASVDSNGKITAKKVGTAAITATTDSGSYIASCTVTVLPIPVSSVSLDKTTASLKVNGTLTLKATVSPSNAADQKITWTSSNSNVAAVSSSGVVTAKSAGSAVITAKASSGKTASCTVTVSALVQASGISLNASSLYLEKGKSSVLKATLSPSNVDVTSVSWTSSNTKVATVDSNGKVTIAGSGEAVITAKTVSGKTAACKVYGYVQQAMHRMYNPNSGEHFYTASTVERDSLVRVGWKYEGVAWTAPSYSDTPVYRLYNPNAGDHHYTTSAAERDALVKVGWKYEGIGWYSDSSKTVALHRLYNPNAVAGAHHYTTSTDEKNMLVKVGWKYENYGWYGLK